MFEGRGAFVRSFLLAPEHHLDPPLGIELDHHVRALVGDPDVVLGVDLHGMRERPGVEVMADLAQIIAVGVELEQLRRRRAIGWAGRVPSMQHEDMALRIERDAGNFAEVEIGRQMQKVRRGFIRDGRDFLSGGETAGREAESGGAGHGKKPAPRPGRERALVATGAGLPVSVAHGRSLPWSPAHAGSLYAGFSTSSDGLRKDRRPASLCVSVHHRRGPRNNCGRVGQGSRVHDLVWGLLRRAWYN